MDNEKWDESFGDVAGVSHDAPGASGAGFVKSDREMESGGTGRQGKPGGGDGNNRNNKSIGVVNSGLLRTLSIANCGLVMHRQKFSSVSILGRILSLNETQTKVEVIIKDNEGSPVTVQKWKTTTSGNSTESITGQLRVGMTVRVFGSPRIGGNNPDVTIVAFAIEPVLSLNEMTSHNLEILASSLILEKRRHNMSSGLPAPQGLPSFSTPAFKQENPALNPQQKPAAGPTTSGSAGNNTGFKQHQQLVLKVISASPNPTGISFTQIKESIRGTSDDVLRKAIEFLSMEGHIYTTIDDDHFRSTEA